MSTIKTTDNYLSYTPHNSQLALLFVFSFISREVKEEMAAIYVKNYMGGHLLQIKTRNIHGVDGNMVSAYQTPPVFCISYWSLVIHTRGDHDAWTVSHNQIKRLFV